MVIAYQFGTSSNQAVDTTQEVETNEEVVLDESMEKEVESAPVETQASDAPATPQESTPAPATEAPAEEGTEEVEEVEGEEEEEKIIACPKNYDPVCGKVDGEEVEFVNECEANKAEASDVIAGKCAEEEAPNVGCISALTPVCGKVDGEEVTFESKCDAESAGATDIQNGECVVVDPFAGVNPDEVICLDNYEPVCVELDVVCVAPPCDPIKKQFNNKCLAFKAGYTEYKEGTCDPVIFVPGIVNFE